MTPEQFDALCAYVKETVQALTWRVVAVPVQGQDDYGGIELSADTQDAELYNTNVCRVVHNGSLAWTGQTKAHIDLGQEKRKPQEGEWVVFPGSAACRYKLRAPDFLPMKEVVVFIINDTDEVAVTPHPERFVAYLG